ncbi:MAG: DUF1573 domain-containing protein [Polaribacter sp.]
MSNFYTENKTFNFGEIKLNDTLNHTFKIKNISKNKLIISKIATSCGCTQIGDIKKELELNEETEIKIQFIPKESQVGNLVKNTVVLEINTEPPFVVYNIKGRVIK